MDNKELTDFIAWDKKLTSGSSWVSPTHKYFFMGIGKTASTRIKLSLHMLEGFEVIESPFPWLHARSKTDESFIPRLADFELDKATDILVSPEWFRFSFVRNPYDRLFSAYKSFIMQDAIPSSPYYNNIRAQIRTKYAYTLRAEKAAATITFQDFVQYVQDTINDDPDYHWCSLNRGLWPDLIRYDFVGHFENFECDFKQVLKKLGVNDELMPALLAPVNESNLKNIPLAAVYNWNLADQVYDLYKDDFENFGYEKNSWLFS